MSCDVMLSGLMDLIGKSERCLHELPIASQRPIGQGMLRVRRSVTIVRIGHRQILLAKDLFQLADSRA
jgi:hypothetical protein